MSVAVGRDGEEFAWEIPALDMFVDDTNQPRRSAGDPRAISERWEVERATFEGSVHMHGRLGIAAAPMQVSGRGTVTVVRHDGLLYVLFHDDGDGSCAQVWVVLGDGEAHATASNNGLRFGTDTWIITGTSVVRLWRNGTYSDGRGTDLVQALTRVGPARSPQVPLVDDATGQGEWLPDPSSGYFRRMADGTYSGSTCLVDPTWRRRRQLEHFDSLDLSWLPLTQLDTERRRISGGAPTWSEPIPGSNVTYLPFWPRVEHRVVPYPPDDERAHDAGLSWPVLHPNGSVALAGGERAVESFTTSRPRVSDVRDGEVSLGSVIMRDGHDQIGATLTPERLVLVAMPKVVEVDNSVKREDLSLLTGLISTDLMLAVGGARAAHRARRVREYLAQQGEGVPVTFLTAQVRFSWLTGLMLETVEVPATNGGFLKAAQPGRSSRHLELRYQLAEREISLMMQLPAGAHGSAVWSAMLAAVGQLGLSVAPATTERRDNGKHGVLTRTRHSIAGGKPGLTSTPSPA